MSSRNVYLTPDQRRQALTLSAILSQSRARAGAGERDAQALIAAGRKEIEALPDARLDYLQICHQYSLEEVATVDEDSVMLLAVFVGDTRLIDNGYLLDVS
jgi:pantoate--beta-alanine ligase